MSYTIADEVSDAIDRWEHEGHVPPEKLEAYRKMGDIVMRAIFEYLEYEPGTPTK
ncbi:MAG: hypothetical protein KKA68_21065 [Gammaproteobacteria bacterium]|nr:hypothetical protein [Gammaproteobacteria bacterium]